MDSYSINHLYEFTPDVGVTASDQQNPLTEVGSLDEAELVDIRLSAQRARLGMLFDLRGSLGFSEPNTALVVLTGVASARWDDSQGRRGGIRDWTARWGDWVPTVADETYTIRTGGMSHMVTVTAARARMYLGTVEGLDDRAIPDMTAEPDAEIIAGFPQWSSVLFVTERYCYPGFSRGST